MNVGQERFGCVVGLGFAKSRCRATSKERRTRPRNMPGSPWMPTATYIRLETASACAVPVLAAPAVSALPRLEGESPTMSVGLKHLLTRRPRREALGGVLALYALYALALLPLIGLIGNETTALA